MIKSILLLLVCIVLFGCSDQNKIYKNDVCIQDAGVKAENKISGIYDLNLSIVQDSKYNSCNGPFDLKLKSEPCSEQQIKLYSERIPKRLYIVKRSENQVSIGIDDGCTGKLFDDKIHAICDSKSVIEDTRIWYELSVTENGVQGKARFVSFNGYRERKDTIFSREYTIIGQRL